ncbi:MAG: FimB/Mfa2 family fimbrial subunit [Prevotella sp.]|jgi:hypothetical protein|nr:FimB/Mfa2 family fimbrial subunit [Prevotella sp.]
MDCYKKTGLFLCVIFMLIMQGCVRSDLDECPEAIRYSVAFKYTLHTEGTDRFYDDVDKMYIYVFDAGTDTCVYADTATMLAPFGNDYTYPLPLNVGRYNIITWGWGRNTGDLSLKRNSAVIPVIVPKETTIDEARLLLEEKMIDGRLEKTFYGELRNVDVPAFISRVDTMPLLNLTNQIRVVIPDAKTAAVQDRISVFITGDNGAYHFESGDNAPDVDGVRGAVTYLPHISYRTDSILLADPIYTAESYAGTGRDSMLIVEISTLRLVQFDANMKLCLDLGNTVIQLSLLEILQSGIFSNIQYNLDKYDRWQISYNYRSTSTTVHVYVMDWHVVYIPTNVGGIMQ